MRTETAFIRFQFTVEYDKEGFDPEEDLCVSVVNAAKRVAEILPIAEIALDQRLEIVWETARRIQEKRVLVCQVEYPIFLDLMDGNVTVTVFDQKSAEAEFSSARASITVEDKKVLGEGEVAALRR